MLEQREKYDPTIYGRLKSEFLKKLDLIPHISIEQTEETQEKKRRAMIKELKEGKLVSIRT